MSVAMLWVLCAGVAGMVTRVVAEHLATSSPLRRRNYRGLEIPTAAGLAIIVAAFAALGALATLGAIFSDSQRLAEATAAGVLILAGMAGFGVLGLWDDVAGTEGERGWRAHLRAIGARRATSGALKLAGGASLSVLLAATMTNGFGGVVRDALVIAMTANLYNMLDLRPGRCGKACGVAVVGVLIVGGAAAPAMAAVGGAVLAFSAFDLRERLMLGDTGANALGAAVGVAIILAGSPTLRLATLIVLAVLHVVADRPGLSRVIDAVPPLRTLDRAGRVTE